MTGPSRQFDTRSEPFLAGCTPRPMGIFNKLDGRGVVPEFKSPNATTGVSDTNKGDPSSIRMLQVDLKIAH